MLLLLLLQLCLLLLRLLLLWLLLGLLLPLLLLRLQWGEVCRSGGHRGQTRQQGISLSRSLQTGEQEQMAGESTWFMEKRELHM